MEAQPVREMGGLWTKTRMATTMKRTTVMRHGELRRRYMGMRERRGTGDGQAPTAFAAKFPRVASQRMTPDYTLSLLSSTPEPAM
jgi:hypothetical protein